MAVTSSTVPEQTAPRLSLEKRKLFVRHHFYTFVNQQDSSQAERSFSADSLDHDKPTGVAVGIEPAKITTEHAYQRWPDLHVTLKDILAEGDEVTVRNHWTGTESSGGVKVEFPGFVPWRFASGKVVARRATVTPPQSLAHAAQF